jgi:RHS repeat-associated protein
MMKNDFLIQSIAEQDLIGGGTPETRLYTGKKRDETGLDYFEARYYDSSLGRFLSVDPAEPDPMNPM